MSEALQQRYGTVPEIVSARDLDIMDVAYTQGAIGDQGYGHIASLYGNFLDTLEPPLKWVDDSDTTTQPEMAASDRNRLQLVTPRVLQAAAQES